VASMSVKVVALLCVDANSDRLDRSETVLIGGRCVTFSLAGWHSELGVRRWVPARSLLRVCEEGEDSSNGEDTVMPGAIVIGVGPGIGLSVARRFAHGGMPVAVIARTRAATDAAVEALRRDGAEVIGLIADSTHEDELRTALDMAEDRYGVPDVLVYNAALVRRDRLGELSAAELLASWAVNVGGAVTAAAHTGRKMAAIGHGTLTVTGGTPEPLPEWFSLSLGKAGVRTLVDLLDQELGPSGVHVTTVTVYGAVASGTAFDPDEIAETYWQLYRELPGEWTREVAYTGSPPARAPRRTNPPRRRS
jgi:NAD(P)-dependent dehydrogenase (short-subunit alcohol dehydrogenase family)